MSRRLKRKRPTAQYNFVQLIEFAADHPTLGNNLFIHNVELEVFRPRPSTNWP